MTSDEYKKLLKEIRTLKIFSLLAFTILCGVITYNMVFLINGHGREIKETAVEMLSLHQCPDFYKEQLKKRADQRDKEKRI